MFKKLAIILAMFLGVGFVVAPSASASVTTLIVFTDWHYQGQSLGLSGGVDCDYSGYHYSWQHQSTLGGASSFGMYNAPHCNRVKMFTTYGGQAVCNLPCYYVGDAFNDQIIAVDVYRGAGT